MTLKISIDGMVPVAAERVVIYQDDTPVAAAHSLDGSAVVYGDAVRDPDFKQMLSALGVTSFDAVVRGPRITGGSA